MTLIKTHSLHIHHNHSASEMSFPDLVIGQNDRVLLLGASGSGKTTLLSILAGLLSPNTGQVFFKEQDFYALTPRQRDTLRGQNFGFVFQTLHLLPALTIEQNILLAADMAGLPAPRERLTSLLNSLGLADKAHRKPSSLSHGEQQRAALARALLNSPAVLIADEPTSALDDKNADIVMDLLVQHATESGAALLVATHDNRITRHFDTVITLSPILNKEAA